MHPSSKIVKHCQHLRLLQCTALCHSKLLSYNHLYLSQTKNIKYIVISRWYLTKWTIVSWLDGSTWWHKVNMCFFADMRMHYITTYILCKWVSAESTFSVSCSISLVEWWKVGNTASAQSASVLQLASVTSYRCWDRPTKTCIWL